MSEQPAALYLADVIDNDAKSAAHHKAAAAELRRLHEENEALRADAERLDWCISVLLSNTGWLTTDIGCGCCDEGKSFGLEITGRAAIDAVRGKQ